MCLPGDQVVLSFMWSGDLAWVEPVTVVEDSAACTALYPAEHTQIKRPVGADGSHVPRSRSREPRAAVPWQLGAGHGRGPGIQMLIRGWPQFQPI